MSSLNSSIIFITTLKAILSTVCPRIYLHEGLALQATIITTISHSDLKRCINPLVFKAFEKNKFQSMIITFKGALALMVQMAGVHFEYDKFVALFEVIIDNFYAHSSNSVLRHVIDITMDKTVFHFCQIFGCFPKNIIYRQNLVEN